VWAVAFDLKVLFTVVEVDPAAVRPPYVFEFLAHRRGDRTVIRLSDRESPAGNTLAGLAVGATGPPNGRTHSALRRPAHQDRPTLARRRADELGAARFCPDEWMLELGIDLWDEQSSVVIEWGLGAFPASGYPLKRTNSAKA
jgi:hypothetical protein